ncbi:aspartate aminotransferase family protein [Helicobacter monodelphidis]|uniref:aspartate aminotransferase family protein n=1 Tax=Helicobacter sp. 15-1451 TaxID=2004995 RepID=UPI000DCBF777|nr:aspartate aminotransferase family protein [Helicobacter sp. 15-1451]RAX56628.1 aspartate aminotransferase family protein [Helicobacter sp. 15-1451]
MNDKERQLDEQYILSTYNRNYVHFEYGKGATLFDIQGKDYIDFCAGIAVCSVGHGNEELAEAISEQAKKMIQISNLYYIHNQAELAKEIITLSELDGKMFFCNSGAEANECALKIARKYGEIRKNGAYKIITLENSFHGRTISTLKATGQMKMHQYFGPYPDGFLYAKNLADIRRIVNENQECCAVLLELILGEGGIRSHQIEEIASLAKWLKEQHILLMIDEIQTGVFRSGEFLASQLYGIKPDVVTLAKGLAGGVPIGAVITTLKDIFAYGEHGSTFGGNPLSTRAGLKTLEILCRERKSGRLSNRIFLFDKELQSLVHKFPHLFMEAVGVGLMRGLKLTNPSYQQSILQECFKQGVLVLRSGSDVIRFTPPLVLSQQELNEGFRRFSLACSSL